MKARNRNLPCAVEILSIVRNPGSRSLGSRTEEVRVGIVALARSEDKSLLHFVFLDQKKANLSSVEHLFLFILVVGEPAEDIQEAPMFRSACDMVVGAAFFSDPEQWVLKVFFKSERKHMTTAVREKLVVGQSE